MSIEFLENHRMVLCGGIPKVSGGNILNGIMGNANVLIPSLGARQGVIDTLILSGSLVFLCTSMGRTHNFEIK